MTFTGPDRPGAERDGRGGGLGVPRRTKVLVALALLGATFWAGWWARGKLTRDEGAPPTVGDRARLTVTTAPSEAAVVVFEGTLGASDAGSASGLAPDATAQATSSSPTASNAGADATGPSQPTATPLPSDGGPSAASVPDTGTWGTPSTPGNAQPSAPDDAERMTWSVDRDGIQGAVREALPDIRECYQGWLRANPALAGKVTVRFTIATDPDDGERGKVTKAALVASDVGHPLMEGCVLNVMAGLAFEAPLDGKPLDVNYPIILQTEP